MAPKRIQYTPAQLLALQDSPLVKRPDNLPRIEQWIDISASARAKAPPNGKGEDGEFPAKRPLFEPRLGRKSQTGEEIFLGPKMSFSAASAARHKDKTTDGPGDKPSQTEDVGRHLTKFDRFAKDRVPRELDGRDRENDRQRPRFGQKDGNLDEELDGRPRRGGDFNDRTREQKEGGVSLDGTAANRRSGPPRGKFDQPWFKDSSKLEGKDAKEGDAEPRPSWRDRERKNDERRYDNPLLRGRDMREQRVERDPAWMNESQDDGLGHTMEDFAKWKESMKAANGPAQEEVMYNDDDTFGAPAKEDSAKPEVQNLFGLWGGIPRPSESEAVTPSVTKTVKSSRFAGFFAPKAEAKVSEPRPEQQTPNETAPPTNGHQQPVSATAEDQQGFQKFIQMLRTAGTTSGGPQQQAVATPPSHPPSQVEDQSSGFPPQGAKRPPMSAHASSNGTYPPPGLAGQPAQDGSDMLRGAPQPARPSTSHHPREINQQFAPPPMPARSRESGEIERGRPPSMNAGQMLAGRPETAPPARPVGVSRESDFLLQLMQQQQQPRQPFSEAQIYGQGYQRKDAIDMNTMLGNHGPRPEEGRPPGPPPGFPVANKQAFMTNQAIDMRHLPQPPPPQKDNYRGMLDMHQIYGALPQQPQGFEGGLLPWATQGRQPEHPQGPNARPSFPPPRSAAPPGLPQFAPQNLAAHQQPRGPPPQPGQQQFYGPQIQGLPPGYQQIHMNGMPPPPQHHRRPPMPNPISAQQQQNVYDPYMGSGRGGPPMQHQMNHMGYPPQHFMEQRGPGGF